MKKLVGKFLTLGLSIAMLFGLISWSPAQGPSAVDVAAAESTYTGTYYNGITATSGNALLGQLHNLISSTHKTYLSYSGLNNIFPKSDPGLDGKGFVEFYTHETITTGFGSSPGVGNKEHVWAQSLSKQSNGNKLWEKTGAGADLLHIRPTEYTTNNTRGSDKYGEVTGGTAVNSKAGHLAGYHTGGVFEPNDNVKGDVARIVMYVYTHYNTYSNSSVFGSYATTNGSGSSSYFGQLTFTQIMSASNESAAIKLLLEWNELDQVDNIEKTRNEVAFDEQGNRNPFIDHPEYASAIWGDGSYTPNPDSGSGSGSGSGTGSQTTGAFTPIASPVAGTEYYMGMKIGDGKYHYIDGKFNYNGYYLTTTTDISNAKKVTLEASGSDWLIKVDGQYLELDTSDGSHANPVFKAQSTGEKWTWDSTNHIFTWGTAKWFLGTRNDKDYDTIGGCAWSYIDSDYLAVLGTYGTDEPVTPPTDDSEAKIQAALATLSSTKTITTTGTTTLAASSGGVSFQWSTDTSLPEGISFSGNTLTVSKLPANDTAIVFTVTASLNGKTGSKTVTVTVKGTGGGTVTPPIPGDTKTIKITTDSFKSLSSTYDFFDWTADGISGYAFIYGDVKSTGKTMQFNKSKGSYYLANTTELPGVLKSVKITATTSQSWKLLTSSTAYGQVKGAPSGTGTIESPENGVITWTVTDPNAKYFALVVDGSGASKLSSIEITYGSGSQTVDPDPDTPPALTGITVSPATLALTVGGTKNTSDFTVTPQPAEAELGTVSFTTTDTGVIKIENGVIKALAAGKATITVASGNVKTTISVTVTEPDTTKEDTAKVEAALATFKDQTIEATTEFDTTVGGVTLTWAAKGTVPGGISFSGHTLTVTTRPDTDTQITLTVTAKYGKVEKSKDITITVKAKPATPPVDTTEEDKAAVKEVLGGLVDQTIELTADTLKLKGTVNGVTLSWTAPQLPEGITFADNTITVVTRPTEDLVLAFTVKATLNQATDTKTVNVTVKAAEKQPEPEENVVLTPETLFQGKTGSAQSDFNGTYDVNGVSVTTVDVGNNDHLYIKGTSTDVGFYFMQFAKQTGKITLKGTFTQIELVMLTNYDYEKANKLTVQAGDTTLTISEHSTETTTLGGQTYYYHTLKYDVEGTGEQQIVFADEQNNAFYITRITLTGTGVGEPDTPPVDPEPDTHEQDLAAVQAALKGVTDKTIEEAGTTEFPATSGDVALAWALATTEELPEGITFANGKLTVTALPETETTIRLTVTATLNDAEESKTITVTVKAAEKTDPDPVDPDNPPDTTEQDRAAVNAVLGKLTDKTIEGDTTLQTAADGVTLTWTTSTQLPEGIKVEGGKITVTARPATDLAIVFTVKATLNDAEESKTITITVKAAEKTDPDPVDPVDPDPDKPDPDEPDNPDNPDNPDPDEPDKPDPDEPDPDNPGSDTPSTPGSDKPDDSDEPGDSGDTPSTPGDSGDTPNTPENPDEGEAPSQPVEEKKGCGGEIGGAVFAIVAIILAAAVVIVVVEKKRQ